MNTIYDKFVERCGGPTFKAVDVKLLIAQHESVFKTAISNSYVQDMELMSRLSELLTTVMEQCWRSSTECKVGTSEKRWIPVKEYIDNNYRQSLSLDDLSTLFNINKFYLARKFKEEYGYTINQYVTNLRITTAKELLRFTDLNMTEIANDLGYNDSAYFTRVFTKEIGLSPLKFKKQWNNS